MAYKHSDIKGNPEKAREKARLRKGVKHKSTIVRKKLSFTEISDLKATVIKNFHELCEDKDPRVRAYATKEVARYIFPQKREVSGNLEVGVTMNIAVTGINEEKLKGMFDNG